MIALIESKTMLKTCHSNIIQYCQLENSKLYDKLMLLHVVNNHILMDKSQLMGHFLVSMPITIDQRILMIKQMASEYDDMYGCSYSEDDDEKDEQLLCLS